MSLSVSIPKTGEQVPLDNLLSLTRTAVGLGIGMLVADKIKRPARQTAAIALMSVGVFAAVPFLFKIALDRIGQRLSKDAQFIELGLWAAYKMYEGWGNIVAAGAIAGIGNVSGVPCMLIANDATVKAGAFFPATVKKLLRAQRIAFECSLPIIYLVDSAGVFLPMQDEIFPDEDDFGRIFRNNSVISAAGIPQFAAIMGNCVAGGAYLPVLCD